VQAIGIAAAFLWTFPVSYAVFSIADTLVGGLRIDDEEHGLDQLEHDVDAYPEFGTMNGEGAEATSEPEVETAA
jgi:Amt family ammonium transporter